MKKKVVVICTVILAILAVMVFLKKDAIFQRGNPIPYLTAAVRLSETNPYVAVDEANGIYISKRGKCPELFDYFQKETGAEFVEQAGSGYIFSDGNNNYVISSEIYWGGYTVWTMPAK